MKTVKEAESLMDKVIHDLNATERFPKSGRVFADSFGKGSKSKSLYHQEVYFVSGNYRYHFWFHGTLRKGDEKTPFGFCSARVFLKDEWNSPFDPPWKQ